MAVASKESEKDMEEMKIKFEGGNEIEANTFINSLIHFTNIVQEVNKNLDKNKRVEVKIKANKEGSFIVDLLVQSSDILDGVKYIFSKEHLSYAKEVVSAVETVYKVAKHLRGKKPKEITSDKNEQISITNNNGVVNVYDLKGANIYLNSPNIQEAVKQQFETLENDPNVTGLEILDENEKEVVEIEKGEFYDMSSSGAEDELEKNQQIEPVTANLKISSLDFSLKKKWDFYYQGNKISAKVKDEAFSDRVNKGERFGKGDTLEVEMDIVQEYDESVDAYVNKSYTVTRIIDHIIRPSQGNLNL